jgi:VWFA-related protein
MKDPSLSRSLLMTAVSISLIHAQVFGVQATPQSPVKAGSAQDGVIRVTTRLVQVSVVVHDKRGQPLRDLTKDDFSLFDKGQEQKIQLFSKESGEELPGNVAPLPQGVVSNRFVNSTGGGQTHLSALPTSLTVILLDGLNTAFTDQHYAKEALIKFLGQLQPSDRVAIYTLSNGLRVLHDFTSDTESLLAALARHRNQDSSALGASSYDDANTGNDTLDAFLDQANERIANFYQARRIETTLAALQTIALHLAGMPGRKNLIWLSSSFPTIVGQGTDGSLGPDFQNFADNIQMALRTLNESGVAIYPVDARGVIGATAAMPSMAASSRGPNPRQRGMPAVDQRAQNQIIQTQGNMREIADRTGGRAFLNTNDLAGAIRRAMDDTRFTYVLAYAPSHDQWDGKFREIKIKVNRPNVEVRYRQGYYAYPDNSLDQKTRKAILAEASTAPLASTGLGLFAGVPQRPTPETPRIMVRVMLDPREVAFSRSTEGKQEAELDILLVVFDQSGTAVRSHATTLRITPDQTQYNELLKSGVVMTTESEAPTGSARARIVVHDLSSGAVGSVDVSLK